MVPKPCPWPWLAGAESSHLSLETFMAQRIPLVVVGAGGFAQEVVWAVHKANQINPVYDILGYVDDDARKKGAVVYGSKVLGTPDQLDFRPAFICAIGE